MTKAPTTRETADHAELARLAEAAMPGPFATMGEILSGRDAFIAAFTPAVCSALLSEIAALRGEVERSEAKLADVSEQCSQWIAKADEETDRATQAERQRDELRKALEWYGEQARLARLIHREGDAGRHALADDGGKRARDLLATQGADQ